MDKIRLVKAAIKLKQVYTCMICGKEKLGDTVTFATTAHNVYTLTTDIYAVPKRAANMPCGWSSYTDGYKCKHCTTKRR